MRALIVALLGLAPAVAGAHARLSEFENSRFVKLTPMADRLRIAYSVLYGSAPAAATRRKLDADRNGIIDAKEGKRFGDGFASQLAKALRVRVDGRAVAVRWEEIAVGLDDRRVGPFPLAIDLVARIPLRSGARHEVLFDDEHPLERLGETEIVIEEAPGVRLVSASQGSLRKARRTRFVFRGHKDVMGENRLIALAFAPIGGAVGATPDGGTLVALISRSHVGAGGLAWAALVAFALGTLHALGPGHGKSIVAVYLVGSRATSWHAALLGGVLTLTHVGAVLIVGALALWATERFTPERVAPILEAAAGLAITTLGFVLLARRVRTARRDVARGHDHAHTAQAAPTLGAILALGLSAGIVPCPAAIVVLLAAIAVGRVALGLGLIVVFSLGLAAVLVALGVLAVRGRALLDRFDPHGTIARRAPIASAILVTLLGVALLTEPLWRH